MAGVMKILLLVIGFAQTGDALSCAICDKTACVEPLNCKTGVVKDVCSCCNVCAKSINERCGGPWNIHGKCGEGLKCHIESERSKLYLPKHFRVGVCVTDSCRSKTCGFRERCKTNKRGKTVCVCPRRCGKAKFPVCGLSNGKQYRNKCRLRRDECLTKTEIGLLMGKCKKCSYKGREYRFGVSKPDGRPCETCICHHGTWKCKIDADCLINDLPRRSQDLKCLVSSEDNERIVLPCPVGYSCRVPRSKVMQDSFIVGTCQSKGVKSTNNPLLEKFIDNNNIAKPEERIMNDILVEQYIPLVSELYVTPSPALQTPFVHITASDVPSVKMENDNSKDDVMKHVCFSNPNKRMCSHKLTKRWYFNATIQSCAQFDYGGCFGSFNNFISKEKCEEVCNSDLLPSALPTYNQQLSPFYFNTEDNDKDDTSMLLDMCHDMKSGMSYRNGEKWNVDDCISCSCVNGRALCIAASCLSSCSNPVYVEGKCCPVCKNNESEGMIVEMKEKNCQDPQTSLWYHSGEGWIMNNCTKCVCFEGEISCKVLLCSKPSCEYPVKKDGECCPVCDGDEKIAVPSVVETMKDVCYDSLTDKVYKVGEGWIVNDCISCFCSNGGIEVCHEVKCPMSNCDNPIHIQGRCCPVCPEIFHSACVYDDRQYFHGDFTLLNDMCTLCKCNKSMWNCSRKHCNVTDSVMVLTNKIHKKADEVKQGISTNDVAGTENTEIMKEFIVKDHGDFIIKDTREMARNKRFLLGEKNTFHEKLMHNKKSYNGSKHISLSNHMNYTKIIKQDELQSEKNLANGFVKDQTEVHGETFEKKFPSSGLLWLKNLKSEMKSDWEGKKYSNHDLAIKKKSLNVFGLRRV